MSTAKLWLIEIALFAIAVDLVIPPLSLLLMIWVAAMGGTFAVVLCDVPAGATAVGVHAKIIKSRKAQDNG
ncbi:MAG: hypothetical protein RID53_13290 [Coleofasciculus sp. B1-GNL1-01]|uniref:hypothetical protein n=1 Tax=Coleofasciculus sp. B1-GNL1-01 TaxID=3068484 RepID=UPI0032FE8D44